MVSINDILARREEIRRVAARHGASNPRLFGSVVRGEHGPASDVDLLVHLEDDRSLLDQIALMHELEDLLGCKVDVVEDEAVYPGLRERILAEAVDL
jgi:predicted nucleotidyltransferase